jgi:uncharacterized membrane protein YphA (DoxX/SURF4 family)
MKRRETSKSIERSLRSRIVFVIRLLLGLTFLVSGVLKIHTPEDAVGLFKVLGLHSNELALVVTMGLSTLEIAAGFLLISNRAVIIVTFLVIVFLATAILVIVVFVEEPVPCGCFGKVLSSMTDELFLLRNLVMSIAALLVLGNECFLVDRVHEGQARV